MTSQTLETLNAALQHHRSGHYKEAESLYREVLRQQPDNADALNLLGTLAHQHGNYEAAVECISKAIGYCPDVAPYYANLGLVLKALGKLDKAVEAYQEALRLKPDAVDVHNNLGNLLFKQGNSERAIAHLKEALWLKPDAAEVHNNLGDIYTQLGRYDNAIEHLQQALRLKPDSLEIHNNLGNVLRFQEDYEGAIEHYRQALALSPGDAEVHNNLGLALRYIGELDQAYRHYQAALKSRPDFQAAHSNLLFLLSYHVMRSPAETLAAHQAWDHACAVAVSDRYVHNHVGDPDANDPGKRLRIGYVSPDLCHHAVSYFFEPLLAGHDRSQVEVYCYAEVSHPDTTTDRLQHLADHWRSSVGLSDAALAEQIHNDGIDVLIDLAGHTVDNRLKVFTYKPAPVQATYLGYFATTGLATMDYWITDQVLTPEDTIELATESIYRLPRCCLSYMPPDDAPEVTIRSAEAPITFGSFNDLSKVSEAAVRLWSDVLKAVPDSQLLIKARQLSDHGLNKKLLQRFSSYGIAADRLVLHARVTDIQDHLRLYGEVDIALDSIPRTGGTTTMEALWMGVPVITLAGERFIERLSASMLTTVGLTEHIASSEADYIAKAVALAGDQKQRETLRKSLRGRLKDSPLCDGKALAHSMEDAYRDMWRRYLAGESG